MQLKISSSHAHAHIARSLTLAGLALAGAGLLAPTAWSATLPPLQHQGSAEFVSGGIGIDQSTLFKDSQSKFPLSMTFDEIEHGEGDYLANVKVMVINAHGKTVLDTTAQGPYLLAKVPDGKYQVKATFNGHTQTRDVMVGHKSHEHLVFSWHHDMRMKS